MSFVSLLNDTSSEIIYPLLPTFLALTLGASPFAIGVIEGIAESIASLIRLVSGYLSDRFNSRKIPVFIVYAIATVTRPFLAFASNWEQVLFLRMTDRAGKGIRGAPRDALLAAEKALVADLVPPIKRGTAFGLYSLSFGITVLPASLLFCGLWRWYGAPTAFIFNASLSIVAAIFLLTISESNLKELNT